MDVTSSSTETQTRVVCVLGVHRSGTSLANRIVNLLGFYLGPADHLMKPTDFNPRGFWEHQLLTDLNDEILARLGGNWHEPPAFPSSWESSVEFEDLRRRARAVIEQDFAGVSAWTWKDPRACLTLPFWQHVMPPMRYVISLRSPVDVARSLQKRDEFSFQKGVDLWLTHLQGSLQHSSGRERMLLFYEDLMEHPTTEVERLSRFLGAEQAWADSDIRNQVLESLDEQLYHHRTSLLDVTEEPQLAFPAKALYLVLRLAAGRHRQGTPGDLHLRTVLDQFAEYAANARHETSGLASRVLCLDQARLASEEQVLRLTAERDQLERYRHRITAAHDRYAEVTTHAYSTAVRRAAEQEARLLEITAEMGTLRTTLASRDEQLAAIGRSLGWRLLQGYRRLKHAVPSFLRSFAAPLTGRTGAAEVAGSVPAESESGPTVLVLRSTEPDRVRRAVQHAREQFPDRDIGLVLDESEEGLFDGWPGVDRFYPYRAHRGLVNGVLHLLATLRGVKGRTIILPTAPGLRSPHISLFLLLAFLIEADERLLMDPAGRMQPALLRHLLGSIADVALFCSGLPVAWLATTLVLFCVRKLPAGDSTSARNPEGALAFLVPVLPDISHTFIYRELLSLLAQYGRDRRFVVVALEEGSYNPLHDEATELLAHAVFLPPGSLAKYLAFYLYYLLSRPRRMARLIASYALPSEKDPWMFLRARNLHGLHPSRGLPLTRLLERENVGHIHCYGTSYPATRALVAATLLDVPFSLSTFVDFDYDYAFKCLPEKLMTAQFVVACTNFCKKRLANLGGTHLAGKIHVIHHGLGSRGAYGSRPEGVLTRGRKPSVFTACRLVEKKGLDYLVRACWILKQRGVACRCLIIGEGPERRRLEALAAELAMGDDIEFLGALPNDEIWRRTDDEDICVVPSVYCSDGERDGIPVILLEALARGHAVVSTRVSGIPELIATGEHGLLVAERDADALAAAIETLLQDQPLRQRLAVAGRDRVQREFNVDEKARQLWTLLGPPSPDGAPGTGGAPGGEARELGSVNVILVNHNGAHFMPALFESLSRQTKAPAQVWLFDNNSTDDSLRIAAELFSEIKIVRYARNTGYSFPVNEGIRRSGAEYQLVLNVDVILEDKFIEEMVAALERFVTAGWAAGRMLKLTPSGKSVEIDCLGHHMSRRRYATETDHSRPFTWPDYERERFVFGASACAALYRSSMLEDLRMDGEYFDEDFFAYFEDVDLDWRAQLRGWKCVYVPSAVGYHARGGSGLIRRPEIAACYLANRWLMLIKNDRVRHFTRDLIPFSTRLLRDVGLAALTQPASVWLSFKRLIQFLPRMLTKRRTIQRRRVVPGAYIRSLIR